MLQLKLLHWQLSSGLGVVYMFMCINNCDKQCYSTVCLASLKSFVWGDKVLSHGRNIIAQKLFARFLCSTTLLVVSFFWVSCTSNSSVRLPYTWNPRMNSKKIHLKLVNTDWSPLLPQSSQALLTVIMHGHGACDLWVWYAGEEVVHFYPFFLPI